MWNLIFGLLLPIIIMVLALQGRRKKTLANRIPGPRGWFLIGMLPLFLKNLEEIIPKIEKIYRKYENSLFKMWLFNRLFIFITRPEDIEFVVNNPKLKKKSSEYKVLKESVGGDGIFGTNDLKKWKNNRKMLSKGLSHSVITKSFLPIFYDEANVLAEILINKSDPESKECEISLPLNMATMDIIGRSSLGVHFNSQKGGHHPFVENFKQMLEIWTSRITQPWYMSTTLFRFSLLKRHHDRCQEVMKKFAGDLIIKKVNEFKQNNNGENEVKNNVDEPYLKSKTIIEILIENYHVMSFDQIRDEVITIIVGGQETTAMTNAFVIFFLALHQNIQNKVYEEIETIFSTGERDRPPSYEDLNQMDYLERVIKETLRIFPVLPVIGRSLDEEIQIGEHLCPAGSTLILFPLLLHSSSKYYTDPEKFNPDNFLPDASRARHPYVYIPFSAGSRNCIGIKYSMFQIKTVVSTLLRKIKFSLSDKYSTYKDLRIMYLLTLKFVDGCYVKIEPRI